MLYINEELIIKYGGHSDQLSRKFWGMDRFRIRAIANLLDQSSLCEDDRAAAVAILQEKIRIYLHGAMKRGNDQHVEEFTHMATRYA